jgi:hypothetical protein
MYTEACYSRHETQTEAKMNRLLLFIHRQYIYYFSAEENYYNMSESELKKTAACVD